MFPQGKDGQPAREGVLHLRVQSGAALEFQYQLPFLMQRINSHFGYHAIGRIILKQSSVWQSTPSKPNLTRETEPDLNPLPPLKALEGIQDPNLQNALQGLGEKLFKR